MQSSPTSYVGLVFDAIIPQFMIPDSTFIFTDGSSRGNPGPGGFGAIIIAPKNYELGVMHYEVREIGGREEYTTNNRMELQAASLALSSIPKSKILNPKSILIYSDSSYLINGITKWVYGWQKNGWKTTAKKDVENRDLWEGLVNSSIYRTIEWKYVGGHVGVTGNVRCDEIATAFADNLVPKLYAGSLENYSIKHIFDINHDVGAAQEKSRSRLHQRSKAYSYVSMVNGRVETHKTWAECEARVKGKKVRYQKALSAEDERKLIAEWSRQP